MYLLTVYVVGQGGSQSESCFSSASRLGLLPPPARAHGLTIPPHDPSLIACGRMPWHPHPGRLRVRFVIFSTVFYVCRPQLAAQG